VRQRANPAAEAPFVAALSRGHRSPPTELGSGADRSFRAPPNSPLEYAPDSVLRTRVTVHFLVTVLPSNHDGNDRADAGSNSLAVTFRSDPESMARRVTHRVIDGGFRRTQSQSAVHEPPLRL
jgi:hypothetical protein